MDKVRKVSWPQHSLLVCPDYGCNVTSLLEFLPPCLQHYGRMYLLSVSPNESSLPGAVLFKERNTEAKAPNRKKKLEN